MNQKDSSEKKPKKYVRAASDVFWFSKGGCHVRDNTLLERHRGECPCEIHYTETTSTYAETTKKAN